MIRMLRLYLLPVLMLPILAANIACAGNLPPDLGEARKAHEVTTGQANVTDAFSAALISSPAGVAQLKWNAIDAKSNVINVIQLAAVVDIPDYTPPVISAPADIEAISFDGNPAPVPMGQPTTFDDRGAVIITNDAPATFPIGTTTVTWTGTDSSENISTATQLIVVVLDPQYLANLIPDPGSAGKLTLAGIDSDNDGVRDDVQRWIVMTFPNSQKTRAAVTQKAKTMQLILLNASDEANVRKYSRASGKASFCITFVRRQVLGLGSSDAYRLKRELEAIYLNTAARSRAWMQADSYLGGMYGVPSDLSKGCDFDPNALPN